MPISNTRPLTCAEVGNINPAEYVRPGGDAQSNCHPGSIGLMNTGLEEYRSAKTPTGQITSADIGKFNRDWPKFNVKNPATGKVETSGLAGFFCVSPDTVRRWFGLPSDVNPGALPRNCVPLSVIGKRVINLPVYNTRRVFNYTDEIGRPASRTQPGNKARCLFAAAVAVRDGTSTECVLALSKRKKGERLLPTVQVPDGGLHRYPIWNGGDPEQGRPYVEVKYFGNLGTALLHLWGVYTDTVSKRLFWGWDQLTIEPADNGTQWITYIRHHYPTAADAYEYDEVAYSPDSYEGE